ncbi:MAG TPA: hypothetical protein VGP41_17485 [Candidatus Lustribacter sp.]|jgi:hypothetical protein|nr:hypothetical protein [Candidatus Lustribacter sp.]
MPGNVDAILFGTGFVVGAACAIMLGNSLAQEYDRRIIVPATIACALLFGGILGWSLNYFFHFAQQSGP